MAERPSRRRNFARPDIDDVKWKSMRGGVVALGSQGVKLILQTGTVMLLARLLSPEDFGLTGMAATLTGFLGLFRDAGLGVATVQRREVSHEQLSTLFWINSTIGICLTMLMIVLAPAVTAFYGDPRLFWIVVVSGVVFLFSGLTAQHGALITREMRFATQARIELTSLAVSSTVGVVMAVLGWRYWSLVAMSVVGGIVNAAGVLLAVPWLPGPPRRKSGVLSMLHFGGLATLNTCLVFLAWNTDNILLGRFWGPQALGLYSRAYQLATLPVEQWTGTLSGVALSSLSAVQDDPERLSRSFLRAYSLLLTVTIPIAIACPVFANETIHVLLGAKWMEVAPIFRLLSPTSLVFAIANPLNWLVLSTGRIGRAVKITAGTTPVVIIGVVLGLSHGPTVAFGYSAAMVLIIIPIAAWSKQGAGISWLDLWTATKIPLLAGILAGIVTISWKTLFVNDAWPPIVVLLLGSGLLFGVFGCALLAMGQKSCTQPY